MFKKLNKFRNTVAGLIATSTMSLPQQFLRSGSMRNRGNMYPGWENVVMSDEDHYKGLPYGIINNRATATARVAKEFLQSKKGDVVEDNPTHPYWSLIRESAYFSETTFWNWISQYLDLEGVYYLYVLRNSNKDMTRFGKPIYFKMLNPYHIQRIVNLQTGEVGGYKETRNGYMRDIPPSQIIEIRKLNPFNWDEPYAMTDAARDDSYTMNTSGDYTRQSLKNNINAPGAITTDIKMKPQDFENFVARIRDHTKGEPLFGNGSGKITWADMTIDLSKAALKEINDRSERNLLVVGGESKTTLGIEESGTTRETARVQTDLKTENHTIPTIQLILDALNMDYRLRYPKEFGENRLTLHVKNPVDSDQDVEAKKVEIKQKEWDLFDSLVEAGYDEAIAAKYSKGQIGLDKLGAPTKDRREPDNRPVVVAPGAAPKKRTGKQSIIFNDLMQDQEGALQNALVNIEMQLAANAINRIPQLVSENAIGKVIDLITKKEQLDAISDLEMVMAAFYGIILSLQGKENAKDRAEEFGMAALFKLDKESKASIREIASKVSESHVSTVSDDLYRTARDLAAQGKGRQAIISALKTKYAHDITEIRAKAVARTETNRAFTMAQYEADRQFIEQNGLEKQAFKQYETRSDNPCAFCQKIESEGLIPFDKPFRIIGQTVVAEIDGKEKSFEVSFADVDAGNLHTNCGCIYRLVIKDK